MAAGEYASVSSQRDAEQADIGRERRELAADPGFEQPATAVAALALLALLGAIGARLGGAPARRAALRVTVGGILAMGLTALIGQLVGAAGL